MLTNYHEKSGICFECGTIWNNYNGYYEPGIMTNMANMAKTLCVECFYKSDDECKRKMCAVVAPKEEDCFSIIHFYFFQFFSIIKNTIFGMSSGSSTASGTKSYINDQGFKIIERFNVVRHWNNMGRGTKCALAAYGAFALSYYMFASYNDGKEALLTYRQNPDASQYADEWIAVRSGCSEHAWDHFVSSIIFPWKALSSVAPSVVLWMNPRVDQQ